MLGKEYPFALATQSCSGDTRASTDYFFDNSNRSGGQCVIIQQTISGAGVLHFAGKLHCVPEGSLFVALVPEKSRYYFDPMVADHWTFRWVNFMGGLAERMWGEFRQEFGPVVSVPDGTLAHRELGRLIRNLEDGRSQTLQAKAESAYSAFVTCWSQQAGLGVAASDPVEELRERIRSRFHEPVNIKELSADLGNSREHLAREFKARYLTEPGAYLRQLRLKNVEVLLEQSTLAIDEIARCSGFSSAKPLIRAFNQTNGLSPGAWRRRARAATSRKRK